MQITEHQDDWPPPPRRRIYLMRHGEVEYFDATGRAHRPETVPLTEGGKLQAAEAGRMLAGVAFDLALTSGLRRTEETARLIVEPRGLAIQADTRLREIEPGRMSDWEKAPPAMVRQVILRAMGDELTPDSRFLGGETLATCQERILAAWRDLLARSDWMTVLLVGHGVVNRLLLAHCLGSSLASLGRIEQDTGCINLIEIDRAGTPLVRMVNVTSHDPGKQSLRLTTLETLYEQYLRGRSIPSRG